MMFKRALALVAALLVWSVPAGAQDARTLDISFNNGRVTLVAQNVTLREILAEWARKGGSKIVDAEKLTGAPVQMTEFRDQPEAQVLITLLRDVPGYGASMREIPAPGASSIGAVFILATRAPTSGSSAGSASAPPPANRLNFENPPQPQGTPRMIQGSPDDEIPPVPRATVGQQPPVTANAPAGQATPNPNLRVGPGGMVTSTVPGVIIPVQGAPPGPGPAPAQPTTAGRGRGGGGGTRF